MAVVLREQLIHRVIREQSCQTYCGLLSQWEFCHRLHWSQQFSQVACYSAALSLWRGLTSATMTWFGDEETTEAQVPFSNIKFSSSTWDLPNTSFCLFDSAVHRTRWGILPVLPNPGLFPKLSSKFFLEFWRVTFPGLVSETDDSTSAKTNAIGSSALEMAILFISRIYFQDTVHTQFLKMLRPFQAVITGLELRILLGCFVHQNVALWNLNILSCWHEYFTTSAQTLPMLVSGIVVENLFDFQRDRFWASIETKAWLVHHTLSDKRNHSTYLLPYFPGYINETLLHGFCHQQHSVMPQWANLGSVNTFAWIQRLLHIPNEKAFVLAYGREVPISAHFPHSAF